MVPVARERQSDAITPDVAGGEIVNDIELVADLFYARIGRQQLGFFRPDRGRHAQDNPVVRGQFAGIFDEIRVLRTIEVVFESRVDTP